MIRLDKLLAHCNYGSRKEVRLFIRKGLVSVNGNIVKDDDCKIDEENDEIVIMDENVSYSKNIYILLNKPMNMVSATYDLKKKTVLDLLPEYKKMKIFPVGRLDIDTTGLLLLTNDGLLAHQLLAPKNHVDKKYEVLFEGNFKESNFLAFQEGIVLEDGYQCMPAQIELIDSNRAILTLHEGKFHQVKRMFKALNMQVIQLKRISFGPLQLDEKLKEGEYRLLTQQEIALLKNEK